MKIFYFADRDPCSESGGRGVDYADDGVCDDANNIEICQWDGGDCCGDNVITTNCSVCACLDPRETTVATTTITTTTTTTATTENIDKTCNVNLIL